jgi:hypothetical protein
MEALSRVGATSPVQVGEWFYWDKKWIIDPTLEIRNTNGLGKTGFSPIGGTCEKANTKYYSCNEMCQPWGLPCEGSCPKHLCLVDGQCVFAPTGFYSCGSLCQPLTVPCRGRCPRTHQGGSVNVENTCVYGDKEIWQCNGKNYFLATPCQEK